MLLMDHDLSLVGHINVVVSCARSLSSGSMVLHGEVPGINIILQAALEDIPVNFDLVC